jgi:hypothetical protein
MEKHILSKKEDGKTCVMLKFHACLSIDVEGRSRGLSVMWKENMKCRIMNYSKHFINIIVNDGDKEDWRLTCRKKQNKTDLRFVEGA